MSIVSMQALVLKVFPTLKWRHHGIGVLQAYVTEHCSPEVRVHVWDPRLVRPGIREAGDIHDHRFALASTIIAGSIREHVYETPREDPEGEWVIYSVENARSAGEARGFDGATEAVGPTRYTAGYRHRKHSLGDTYEMPRAQFHATFADDTAVTICRMYDKRGQARLLVPHDKEPVHAFGAHDPALAAATDVQTAVLSDAVTLLEVQGLFRIEAKPIPLRLPCPSCGTLHLDVGEFATKPHHTHACQMCGMVWRPAVPHTVGVDFLPGFKNE